MSDSKISDLTTQSTIHDADLVPLVDTTDTSMSAQGTTKKSTWTTIVSYLTGKFNALYLGIGANAVSATTAFGATLDTDGTLTANSDTNIPSQKAVKTYGDRALNTTLTRIPLNAPQGYMINGKFVPSVASNNLTVALKTLAGTDPSATDPVYVRIGDTVRTISAALSVTKNAATNWFNAGSAELATKEIDYFVYLGYNATDGVTLGFSRIPGASQYSDFSATTTNEKYCAISTITTAAATDYYENVGRFAATLSAGAGYTWTVPTFTAINLIQRPIFETRLLSYAPTITSQGGTPTTTSAVSKYKIIGSTCLISESITITNKGTATGTVKVTVPISCVGTAGYVLTGQETFATGTSCKGNFTDFGAGTLSCTLYSNGTLWVNTYIFDLLGTYPI